MHMNKKLICLLIILLLISCKKEESILIKQISTNEMATINLDYQYAETKDSICLTIPIEFEIIQKKSDLKSIHLYYIKINNRRLLDDISDYQVYDKQNKTTPIYFSLNKNQLSSQQIFKIIVKIRTQMISKKDAQEILKKYSINQSIETLKLNDIIKLKSVSEFKKRNKNIIDSFRKINDSIVFVYSNGEENQSIKKKINW